MTREEIHAELTKMLVEMFEVDEAEVKPDARLYEDLDIDSIDAVDMVVRIREITGKKIMADDFKNVRTVDDVVTAVEQLTQQQ